MTHVGCKLFGTAFLVATAGLVGATGASAQTSAEFPPSIVTRDKFETRLGPLEFKDGAPDPATVTKIYDNLDFTHAFEAFVNTLQGVSIDAIHKGLLSAG